MKKASVLVVAILLLSVLCSCGVWGGDGTVSEPQYITVNGEPLTFKLQLRDADGASEVTEGDAYPHSGLGGELIAEWTVPMYGNTVYEAVNKYFEDREESFTFRLSGHKFYMFSEYRSPDGVYNLETAYIAADGEYSDCANHQLLLGEDGVAGTDDDLKTVTIVYKGWLK